MIQKIFYSRSSVHVLLALLLLCCLCSSVSALVKCTSPCECLTEAQAKEKFGSYVKCSEDVCGYYESAVAKLTINKYCYRELDKIAVVPIRTLMTVTATPTPTPTLTRVICPEPCECASLETAASAGWTTYCGGEKQICGYDKSQNPLYCWEPYVTCREGCTCLSRDEGAEKNLALCDGKLAVCGETETGLPKYCYESPPPLTRVVVVATTVPVTLQVPITVAPVTQDTSVELAPFCQLSGDLTNFRHGPEMVRVKIQKATYIPKSCLKEPPFTCTGPFILTDPGSSPTYADVDQQRGYLHYSAFVQCGGSYRISMEPVDMGACQWSGTWTATKSSFVAMNGVAQDDYDFAFVPDNNVEDIACDLCHSPTLPSSFDWRSVGGENWITPVRDQFSCGSCWAMATLGVIEAMTNIEADSSVNLNLAEQNLISCPGGGGTCGGGWPFNAAIYIRDTGVVTETCFPYVARNDPCVYACRSPLARWKIDEHTTLSLAGHIPRDTNGWKRALLCNGPLAVCDHHHCVTLVGWNDATSSWTFKNSWGTDWGDDGYGTRLYTSDTWMLYAWWFGGAYQ